jgi:hypothetical protein
MLIELMMMLDAGGKMLGLADDATPVGHSS